MVARSQNGWSADSSLIARYTIPGSKVKLPLRKGDVSVVLLEFLRRYNAEVESLRQYDTGGYVYRAIIGAGVLSNHASGTAVDVCWRKHPLGARGTYTAKQVAAVRNILRDFDGVLRWGYDYRTRKDEMHFEINKSSTAVRNLANKFRARKGKPQAAPVKPKPAPVQPRAKFVLPPWAFAKGKYFGPYLKSKPPVYKTIENVQRKLYSIGYNPGKIDGQYGPTMHKAVLSFQAAEHLARDGKIGPITYNRLRSK